MFDGFESFGHAEQVTCQDQGVDLKRMSLADDPLEDVTLETKSGRGARSARIRFESAGEPPHALSHLLITRVGIDNSRQRASVPGESLRQEQVAGLPVDARHRRVTQAVERVQAVEASFLYPLRLKNLCRRDSPP
jgi:hypothetical protein